MFDNLALPFEVGHVFEAISGIFDALPFAMKAALIACFGVACFFAITKMLF